MNEQASLSVLKREARLRLIEIVSGLFIVTITVSVLARYWAGVSPHKAVYVVEVLYGLVLLLVLRLACRFQSVVLSGWLIILGLLLTIFVTAHRHGGLSAPILMVLPLVPILAMLLLNRHSWPIVVVLMSLLLLGLANFPQTARIEMLPLDEYSHTLPAFLVLVAVTLLCMVFLFCFDHQNDQMHHQLILLANTDGLTGVANRRLFDERLSQEWLRNKRIALPLSLLLVDIDHFKRYNDVHGHVEGDRCLRAVAQGIASHCRRSGELVARYGGEEFGVILPNVDLAEAAAIADSLRGKVEALHRNGHPDLREPVTVSIGFASMVPHHFVQKEHLIVQADKALYRAKRAGRNQSVGAIVAMARVDA